MRYYAILFDIDGTLLNSTPAFEEIMVQACQRLDWPAPPPDMMQQLMTYRRDPIEMLFGEVADAAERQQALHEAAQAVWEPLFKQIAHPFEDAIDVLQQFEELGFRLGIVTDSNHQVVERITSQPGCPAMDVIITREESGVRKPDPRPMQLALDGIGLDPSAVIYVGDNPGDIEAGTAVGMSVIGITTGPSSREALYAAGAVAVVKSLSELTGLLKLAPPVVTGELTTGLGVASSFTSANGIQGWLNQALGETAYPGTINLECSDKTAEVVARHRHDPWLRKHLLAGAGHYCDAHFHPVTLATTDGGRETPALLMWPEVPDYPPTKLELVCALPLREQWQLSDRQTLTLRYESSDEFT